MSVLINEKVLDKEWIELIIEARNLGIPIEKIKEFLENTPGPK